ncbi:MAG TPA: preprotein translocase subunit YajC [Clostridiaceae bacterium]|jgi:preprotein translocase subunit YajC|nr:preprotein translocase subunit YajC [Clostridiaceae bacterium]HBF76529.1 preprotein translocase subunit YajC [Clostridiaceae bacterium]HBG39146.1 preprotein translocase subunit YajC [Clostridiaceae bacterium]HBN29095.1 preprotein translocase subunit YajC [Clostridiaceae bacterium]HBX48554.1 preprotein translocase subunit YajC [Clostridiaceae bacterium]
MQQGTVATIVMWVMVFAIFYLFLILPEQKRQKKTKKMLDALIVGDKVMTRGGIIGTILNLNEDTVVIESGPSRMKIELARYAISSVVESRAEKYNIKKEDSKDEDKGEKKEEKKEEKKGEKKEEK